MNPGSDVSGLLYYPGLPANAQGCAAAAAPYIPSNITRRDNLPDTEYDLIAIAPWTSPTCVQDYLASARDSQFVQGFLFFLPWDVWGGANSTAIPPDVSNAVWALGDGGAWKRENGFPVYAIPGQAASMLVNASAAYSGNLTSVPYGHLLSEEGYDVRDYVRLFVDLSTLGNGSNLPSLWVFLLVVLGIFAAIIGCTSAVMHWTSRRRRARLRRRVANGEIDLEALGIKRLTVPRDVLDRMPLYTYGSGTLAAKLEGKAAPGQVSATDKLEGSTHSNSCPSTPAPATRPAPVLRTTSFRPTPLSQPTCAICLDDFVPPSPATDSTAAVEGTVVRELPCHHIFHPECVDTFLRDSSSLCPMCKKTALPKGYCPATITNAMVRRERAVRRIRERVGDEAPDTGPVEGRWGRFAARFGLSGRSRRSGDGIQARGAAAEMTPVTPLPPGDAENLSRPPPLAPSPPPPQAASTLGRREWARQRAVAMLGRREAPLDPDDEENRNTPGWRKALRGVFPALGR